MFIVYILKSQIKERYYIGCTSNLKRRILEHNSGKTRSTKAYMPWQLVYEEYFSSEQQAFIREKEIKSYKSGIKFKKLITEEI